MTGDDGWKGQVVIVVMMVAYLAAFTFVSYWCAFGPCKGCEDERTLLRLALLAMSGGGIGSTTYCIRSFYSHYIDGSFEFHVYVWWYVFRPVVACVLSLAFFALAVGQIVIVTSSMSISDSDQAIAAIFSISFLAGFSTEQVVERLRKAAKALFGDEDERRRTRSESD